MKKFLPALAGFLAYKLLGIGGALALIWCICLFTWSESRPRWRWPALAATFVVGLGLAFASLVYFELMQVDLEALPDSATGHLLAFVLLIFSIFVVVGSVLLVPVYVALPWMRRKGIGNDVASSPATPATGAARIEVASEGSSLRPAGE